MANTDDVLIMSDEEFMQLDDSAYVMDDAEESTDANDNSDADDSSDDINDSSEDDENSSGDDDQDDSDNSDDDDNDSADDDDTEDKNTEDDGGNEDLDKLDSSAQNDPEQKEDKPADNDNGVDYAAVGKKVMAEFKANGTTIKIKSADDAIQLMQMGANYNKKMKGLKPSLKALKLLENNGLLDTDKLNYLIDLDQKKPEAIAQLLKDSKIDPMEIDLDNEDKYIPDQHTVNDKELLLDEVLDSISSTDSYSKTLTILGEEWDEVSRKAIADNPEIIATINNHIGNGIYDQVAQNVAYERSLGKLVGVSDFDAYQQIGTYMNENGLFKHSTVTTPVESKSDSKQKQSQDAQSKQRQSRKKAASPSKKRQSANRNDDANYNPLAMSDEEFIKFNKLNI